MNPNFINVFEQKLPNKLFIRIVRIFRPDRAEPVADEEICILFSYNIE